MRRRMCVWSESLCVCVSVWHGLYSPVSTSKWFQLQLHKHYSPKHPHAAIKHHNNTVCSQTSSRADIKLWMADITHTGQREWVSISGWKTLTGWFNQCKNSIENRHTHAAADVYYWVLMCTQHRSLCLFFTSISQTQETLKIDV